MASVTDIKRGDQQPVQKAHRGNQVDKQLIKAMSVAWRESVSIWTP